MEKKKFSTTKFVEMALLVAIILLWHLQPIGYIKTFGLGDHSDRCSGDCWRDHIGTGSRSGFRGSIWNHQLYPVFWNECIWRNAFKHQSGWNICCLCSSTYFDGLADRTDLSGA